MLDKRHPGWHTKIDLERLDMEHGDTCLIGQLYGEFSKGARSLHLTDERLRQFGFHATGPLRILEVLAYELLNKAWTREIKKRLFTDEEAAKQAAGVPQEPFYLVA